MAVKPFSSLLLYLKNFKGFIRNNKINIKINNTKIKLKWSGSSDNLYIAQIN